jgi:hypothetical protein
MPNVFAAEAPAGLAAGRLLRLVGPSLPEAGQQGTMDVALKIRIFAQHERHEVLRHPLIEGRAVCEEVHGFGKRIVIEPACHHEGACPAINLVHDRHHVDGVVPCAARRSETDGMATTGTHELLRQARLLIRRNNRVVYHQKKGEL